MDKRKEVHGQTHGKGEPSMGFKLFLSDLAVLLPPEIFDHLASGLEFPQQICDKLEVSDKPVQSLIVYLQERDIIKSNDISRLIKALESLEKTTVRNKVMTSFQKWTSKFPEEKPPTKLPDKPEPRKVLEAVKRIQEPEVVEKAKPEPRKVLDAVQRINNSEKEQEKKPEPRKVLEAAKRIDDVEQNAGNKTEIGKVMEVIKRFNATKRIERLTYENGKVTEEINRIVDTARAERRAKVQRRISAAINPGSESKRLEQDNKTKAEISEKDKEHLEKFLNHLDLSFTNKLTIKDGTCIKLSSNTEEETADDVSRFFTHLAAGDYLVTDKLSSTYKYQQGYAKSVCGISKWDILFAILTCCDEFMLQDILGKLHYCGNAVPLILPSPTSSKLTFCLWGLRKCVTDVSVAESLTPTAVRICTQPLITISALRFGEVKLSKSKVLNKLLNKSSTNQNLRCFLSNEEDPERNIWSKGVVEATWNIHGKENETQDALPPFSLVNLRGDGLCHSRQVKFCVNVSNIVIVFLSLRLTGKYIQEVNQMTASSQVVVVLDCLERYAINLSSSNRVTFLFCKGLTPQEISEKIKTCLLNLMQSKEGRKWSAKTLEEHSKVCHLFDIDVDEDEFKEAKTLANKIGSSVSLSVDQSKSRIFPLQNNLTTVSSAVEQVDGKVTDQSKLKSPLSFSFNTFLKGMLLDDRQRQIFLSLLKIILDEKSCNAMTRHMQQYRSLVLQFRKNDNDSDIVLNDQEKQLVQNEICVNDPISTEAKIEENMISIDHFLFELWRLVQCSHPGLSKDFTLDAYLTWLGSWLLNGNSIDILKSDPCQGPDAYPQTILKGLQSVLPTDAKVFVVASLGETGTSKSELVKHLFGVNITRTEIMVQSGIRIHLIHVKNASEKLMECDFVILADVENIKLSETVNEGLTRRREYICTLVSTIADMLIVSFENDSTEIEKSGVFDILVHNIITSRTCKASMQCCVVYNVDNVSDKDAHHMEEYTLNKLKDSCSKIQNVTKVDDSGILEENDFYDAIRAKFASDTKNQDSKLHLFMLPSLPKCESQETNQTYVKSIQDLRNYLMQMFTNNQHTSSTLSEISEKISCCFSDSTTPDDLTHANDQGD